MRLIYTILGGTMMLGIVAPSWGQYPYPYRPYGGSRYSPQQLPPPYYGPPGYGSYQTPGYGSSPPPGYGAYQAPHFGGYPVPGYGGSQQPQQSPRAQQDGRHLWVYGSRGEGTFRDMGNSNWVESNTTGEYYFRETARTSSSIDLFDPSRNAFARLTDRVMYHHGLGDPTWHQGYIGQWE